MVSDKTSIFTAAMRTEFLKAYDAARETAKNAPHVGFTTEIPSTARIEEYPWMSPPPRLSRYVGRRRYTQADATKYRVPNIEFDAAFRVQLRDIEDDQVGGYGLQSQALAKDVVGFPGRECLKILRDGKTGTHFDGTAFFANSHTLGTGDNLIAKDYASNDAATFTVIALVKTGVIKPVLWQNRKDKGLMDNGGTKTSEEEKAVKYWYDYEGAAAYGFWWDAIRVDILDTPTLAELEALVEEIEYTFRGFKLEASQSGEDDIYVHDQLVFSPETLTYLVSPKLENKFKTLMNNQQLAVSGGGNKDNIFRGHGEVLTTGYLA